MVGIVSYTMIKKTHIGPVIRRSVSKVWKRYRKTPLWVSPTEAVVVKKMNMGYRWGIWDIWDIDLVTIEEHEISLKRREEISEFVNNWFL